MLSIEDYLEGELGVELIRDGHNLRCCCPIHGEREASLVIFEDGHGHCYGGCPRGHNHWRDVVDLVADVEPELRAIPTKRERLAAAFAFCRGRGWLEVGASLNKTEAGRVYPNQRARAAEERHLVALTIAFRHWHRALIGVAGRGSPGLDYLVKTRRLAGPFLRQCLPAVGYAPYDARVHDRIVDEASRALGAEASRALFEAGVTTKAGGQRLRGYVIFPSFAPDGRVAFFQARTIDPAAPGHKRFLNARLAKLPYVPLARRHADLAAHPGTRVGEGPMDALAFAAQGYFAAALMTGHLPDEGDDPAGFARLAGWPEPRRFYGDNEDESKPGPALRRDAVALGLARGWDHRPGALPADVKDPMQWLAERGAATFARELEELDARYEEYNEEENRCRSTPSPPADHDELEPPRALRPSRSSRAISPR